MNKFMRNQDVVVGLAVSALGGIFALVGLQIPTGPVMSTLPPQTVPLICSIGIVLCGIFQIGKGLLSATGPKQSFFDSRQVWVLTIIFIFLSLFERSDYRLSIPIFILALMVALGCKNWKHLGIIPLATTGIIWVFFQKLFSVYLPTWI